MKIVAKYDSKTLYEKIDQIAESIVSEEDLQKRVDLYNQMMKYIRKYRRVMYDFEKFIYSYDNSLTEKEWD